MIREGDRASERQYWLFVRGSKAVVGVICAMGAYAAAVRTGSVEVTLGLAIIAGLMFDAPGITRLVSHVVEALPWTPKVTKRKEDTEDGQR